MNLSKKQIYIIVGVIFVLFTGAFSVAYVWVHSIKEKQEVAKEVADENDPFVTFTKQIKNAYDVDLMPLHHHKPQTIEEKKYVARAFELERRMEAEAMQNDPEIITTKVDEYVARYDLNKDGEEEYIATYSSNGFCGTEGCPFRVDTFQNGELRSLLPEGGMIAHIAGVFVVASTTNGVHNLAFMDNFATKASIFVWDGEKYERTYELSVDNKNDQKIPPAEDTEKTMFIDPIFGLQFSIPKGYEVRQTVSPSPDAYSPKECLKGGVEYTQLVCSAVMYELCDTSTQVEDNDTCFLFGAAVGDKYDPLDTEANFSWFSQHPYPSQSLACLKEDGCEIYQNEAFVVVEERAIGQFGAEDGLKNGRAYILPSPTIGVGNFVLSDEYDGENDYKKYGPIVRAIVNSVRDKK